MTDRHAEFSQHDVNGVQRDGLPGENFHRVLPVAGWPLDYLRTATYLARLDPDNWWHMPIRAVAATRLN